jgi:hypothetical protein
MPSRFPGLRAPGLPACQVLSPPGVPGGGARPRLSPTHGHRGGGRRAGGMPPSSKPVTAPRRAGLAAAAGRTQRSHAC